MNSTSNVVEAASRESVDTSFGQGRHTRRTHVRVDLCTWYTHRAGLPRRIPSNSFARRQNHHIVSCWPPFMNHHIVLSGIGSLYHR